MRHPAQLGVTLRDGIVHLSGFITDERFQQAAIVTAANVLGVRPVHDHLYLRDAMSGLCFRSPEDDEWAKAGYGLANSVLRLRDDPAHSAAAGVVLAVPSRAAAMASSTRSSQMNSSLLRALSGMSS